MKKILRSSALAALFLVLAAPLFAQDIEKSLLWEVSGNGLKKPSYLFGTYHTLNEKYMNDKQQKALDAFLNADGVVVETLVDTADMMKVQRYMVMPGNHLSKLLDTASYRLVNKEVMSTMGMGLQSLDQFKPAAVMTLLTIQYITQAYPEIAKYGGLPLDQFFAQEAIKSKRQFHQMETSEEQAILVFNHFTLKEQADQLADLVRSKPKAMASLKRIAEYYLAGDIQGLEVESQRIRQEMPAYGNSLLLTTERNKRWAAKLPAIMKEGSQFIAVSVLNLSGKEGLIALLRKAGYTVKAVK